MRRFVLKSCSEFRFFEHRNNFLDNATGQENTAARHENQSQITGHAPQIGGKKRKRFARHRVCAIQTGGGNLMRRRKNRRLTIGLANGRIEIDQTTAAQNLFGRYAPANAFEMGEDGKVPIRARPQINMAAFAGNRNPTVPGIDQPRDTQARARPENHPGRMVFDLSATDGMAMLRVQRGCRQRLRLKIIEDDDIIKEKILDHLFWPDNPWTICQVNFIAVHRSGNGENR